MKIIVSNCDVCGANRTPVFVSAKGKRCKVCDPAGFEEQARSDIDAWLRGD